MNRQISEVHLLPRLHGTARIAILIHTRHVNGLVKPPDEGPCTQTTTDPRDVLCGYYRYLDNTRPNSLCRRCFGASVAECCQSVTPTHAAK